MCTYVNECSRVRSRAHVRTYICVVARMFVSSDGCAGSDTSAGGITCSGGAPCSSVFAGELKKRQRVRAGTGGAGGGLEREHGEESECTEEAKEANGDKEQAMEGQSAGVRDR